VAADSSQKRPSWKYARLLQYREPSGAVEKGMRIHDLLEKEFLG
jgi:hypothetical protein